MLSQEYLRGGKVLGALVKDATLRNSRILVVLTYMRGARVRKFGSRSCYDFSPLWREGVQVQEPPLCMRYRKRLRRGTVLDLFTTSVCQVWLGVRVR